MDMGELLGALIKSQASKSGGGGLGELLGGLLGGKTPAARSPQTERGPAAGRSSAARRDRGQAATEDVARDAYRRFEERGRGGARQAPPSELENERMKLLVRAMVSAAKSDGQLDEAEQKSIFSQLGEVTQDEVDFLRAEFAKPLDVRSFAWDVPLGLEESVYGFSLMSIDLDRNKEATYLRELAHGLRLDPETCNAIHRKMNEPTLF